MKRFPYLAIIAAEDGAQGRAEMRRLLVCCAAVFLYAVCAYADGIYLYYHATPPTIPSQRAIIIFKDGVERLQVESLVQSEGDSLAWVLPVPSLPSEIKEASPGFLKTLTLKTEPRVVSPELFEYMVLPLLLLAIIVTGWVLAMLAFAPDRKAIPVCVALLFGFCIGPLFCVSLGVPRGSKGESLPSTVRVEKTVTVGNYDVRALDAPDAQALDTWLTQNGFAALPAEGRLIAESYIKEGWRFVAAKLRTRAGALLRPHPLELTFATKEPVYPMRLTALAGCDVYVQLYVIADRAYKSDRLTTEYVSTVEAIQEPSSPTGTGSEALATLYSDNRIKHPDTLRYLWKGSVLTRCAGSLSPSQMDKDLVLSEDLSRVSQRKTYYMPEASSLRAKELACWVWVLVMPLFVVVILLSDKLRFRRGCILAAIAVVGTTAAAVGGICFAITPVHNGERFVFRNHMRVDGFFLEDYLFDIAAAHDGFSGATPAEVETIVRDSFTFVPFYPWGGAERLIEEDSPGNFTVRYRDGMTELTFFGRDGEPKTHVVQQFARRRSSMPKMPAEPRGGFEDWIATYGPGQVICGVQANPQALAEPVIWFLERTFGEENQYAIDTAAGALGLAARIVPPDDLEDRDKLNVFLAQVKERLNLKEK